MLTPGTPFTWYFVGDADRQNLSIYRNIYGKFCLQRKIPHTPLHCTIETLSSHETLEAAVVASEAL